MHRVLALTVVALLAAVPPAHADGSLSRDNGGASESTHTIHMEHYSVKVPYEWDWSVAAEGGMLDMLFASRERDGCQCYMQFVATLDASALALTPEERSSRTAEESAAAFFEDEHEFKLEEMKLAGVSSPPSVKQVQTTLGGRPFHVMEWEGADEGACRASQIYLHFPEPAGNDFYYIATCSQTSSGDDAEAQSCRDEFVEVLSTFRPFWKLPERSVEGTWFVDMLGLTEDLSRFTMHHYLITDDVAYRLRMNEWTERVSFADTDKQNDGVRARARGTVVETDRVFEDLPVILLDADYVEILEREED
jgi:hypothetical protein